MYYVLLAPGIDRQTVLADMKHHEINSVFHYVPLHSSPAGIRYGRTHATLNVTETNSSRLVRLPMWFDLTPAQQNRVVEVIADSAYRLSS
jgi:dTDP-4-amino-4,6-dideoxygalactose transaminase